jgi:hypothetical protein
MSGVIYNHGDILKTGPGKTVLNSPLSLDIDTADYSYSGKLVILEGTFNTMGYDVSVNHIDFSDDNLYTELNISNSKLRLHGSNDHIFDHLDTLIAVNSMIVFDPFDNDQCFLQLDGHSFDTVMLQNHSNLYGEVTIEHLVLNAGNIYSFSCVDDISIQNTLSVSGDIDKYTFLRSEVAGDDAELLFSNSSFTQDPIENLIVRDINLQLDAITLDSSVNMGGNSNNWVFNNSPQPMALYYIYNYPNFNAWSDLGNWFENNGASQAQRLPLPIDTVIFDNLSFAHLQSKDTVFLDDDIFYCKDMIWKDMGTYSNTPVMMMKNAWLMINGSIDIGENMRVSSNHSHDKEGGMFCFTSDSNETIKTSGNLLNTDFIFHGNGSWMLEDKLNLGDMFLDVEKGTFISDGYRIFAGAISDGYEDQYYANYDAVIDIRNSLIRLVEGWEPAFNINREDTRVMGEGSHIVLIADTVEFNGGDSKFKKITSHADMNIFLSSDTFNVMRVNAGSYNGIADSIMIERNLFIEDTISDITTFTKYDDFGGWGAGVSLGQGFSSLDKAKIYNNSTNDFCLENVSIEYVDVISSNYTNNYISGDSSIIDSSSMGWDTTSIKCYLDIIGLVKTDDSIAFSDGYVVLFKLNPNSTAIFDTLAASPLDSLGQFMFNNLSPAKYMLKANPRPATGFMPAYCPSEPHWSDADTLDLTSNSSGMVITVRQPPLQPMTPGATITGKLDTTVKSPTPYLNILSDYRGPSEVFDSIVIGIINKITGDLLMLDTTDNDGFFVFTNVPQGQYRLMPDIAGIVVDTFNLNDINVGSPADSFNLVFEVDSNLIYVADTSSGTLVSTSFLEQHEVKLKLWPNPVRNQMNILSDEHIRDIKLYDQMMREINPKGYSTGTNQYVLDLSGLKKGIYHLRINGLNVKHRILKL